MGKTWVLLQIPQDVLETLLKSVKQAIVPTREPHISVIKDEKPCLHAADWDSKAFDGEKVKFQIDTRTAHDENSRHVWFDCYSPRLCAIREHFGLTVLKRDDVYRANFHVTVGKLAVPVTPHLRPQYRLSIRSHIDVETMMQHI